MLIDEIIERLRQLPFVSRVLIEQRTHLEKIVAQDGLARMHDGLLVLRQRYGRQDDDDRNNDHQLEQRKAERGEQWAVGSGQRMPPDCGSLFARCELLTACPLLITSHYTSLHSVRSLWISSEYRKCFHRPRKLNPQDRNMSESPIPLCRSSDLPESGADRSWFSELPTPVVQLPAP